MLYVSLLYFSSSLRSRLIATFRPVCDFRSHSLIRRTDQPRRLSTRAVLKSRRLLVSTFAVQKDLCVLDSRLHLHPCQKQPSTNITRSWRSKTKSGLPGRFEQFIRQPDTPLAARQACSRRSVVLPPRDLTSDIIRERALAVTLSIIC